MFLADATFERATARCQRLRGTAQPVTDGLERGRTPFQARRVGAKPDHHLQQATRHDTGAFQAERRRGNRHCRVARRQTQVEQRPIEGGAADASGYRGDEPVARVGQGLFESDGPMEILVRALELMSRDTDVPQAGDSRRVVGPRQSERRQSRSAATPATRQSTAQGSSTRGGSFRYCSSTQRVAAAKIRRASSTHSRSGERRTTEGKDSLCARPD